MTDSEIAASIIPTCAGVGGGWRRIAYVDTSAGGECAGGWHRDTHSNVSFCCPDSDSGFNCS